MKRATGIFIVTASLIFLANSAFAKDVKATFKLSPTGSFVANGNEIKGTITKNADGSISSDRIEIPLDSLKTGMSLRDEHMKHKYLEIDKKGFESAVVTDAKGKDGKGTANMLVHGVKKPISGTYSIEGGEALVKFTINITEYGIAKVKYMGIGVKDEAEIEAHIPVVSGGTSAPANKMAPAPKKK